MLRADKNDSWCVIRKAYCTKRTLSQSCQTWRKKCRPVLENKCCSFRIFLACRQTVLSNFFSDRREACLKQRTVIPSITFLTGTMRLTYTQHPTKKSFSTKTPSRTLSYVFGNFCFLQFPTQHNISHKAGPHQCYSHVMFDLPIHAKRQKDS